MSVTLPPVGRVQGFLRNTSKGLFPPFSGADDAQVSAKESDVILGMSWEDTFLKA